MEDLWWIFSVSLCVKLLLIPAYRSTDFEVHRHWLALTIRAPLSRWYLDTSSPWTLDYPPLFGHFSLLLSLPASLIDATITDLVAGQNYAAPSAVVFLRLSVAITDLLLLAGIHRVTRKLPHPRRRLALALVLWSPALLIVDHIHFQYNGFLLGILMISLSFLVEGWDFAGGVTFAVLICSKHLFMVAAPVYFVYLLRHYCNGDWGRAVSRFLVMGSAVSVVFIATFGPFAYYGQTRPRNCWPTNSWASSTLVIGCPILDQRDFGSSSAMYCFAGSLSLCLRSRKWGSSDYFPLSLVNPHNVGLPPEKKKKPWKKK